MTNNSYLCNFIKNNKDWREILTDYPYFLKIKDENDLTIFNYNILGQKILLEEDCIITKWMGNRPVYENEDEYNIASYFAPDMNVYKDGAYIKDDEVIGDIVKHEIKYCDFTIPEVQEARGIIIDTNNLDVMCWPFRKFGNYGESYVDDIDWPSAQVQEKVDGSIMKLWYDNRPDKQTWCVSTNGMINAFNAPIDNITESKSFGEYFLDGFNKTTLANDYTKNYNEKIPYIHGLNKDYTYIFELVGKYNKVIINYPETKIYHLGTRNNKTGEELSIDIGIDKPKKYNYSNLDDCILAAEKLNAGNTDEKFHVSYEGFVVVDKNFNRIKVKAPEYLLLHHAYNNNSLSKSKILDLVLSNDAKEFISYFPQHEEKIMYYQKRYDKLYSEIDAYCKSIKKMYDAINDRKELANIIKDDKYKIFAFNYIFKQQSVLESFCYLTKKKLLDLLNDVSIEKEHDNIDFDKQI